MERTMRNILLLIVTAPLLVFGANEEKVIKLKKVDSPIVVDGIIDKNWNIADSIMDFFQQQPYYGKEPSKKTVIKVLTTEKSLFCLMICYDEKENIQNIKGSHDNVYRDNDYVAISLDTFGDKKTAYKFIVASSGVRGDCRLLDDARNEDFNWDGIWFSDTKIYDCGYVVEIEIPYKSIQYDENLSYWGLDFDRWIASLKESLHWCAYEQNEGQRISKFGKLLFEDFKPAVKGLNLELYPTAISKTTYTENKKYKVEPDAGLDIFYNPSPQLTFQATVNPDFAQIEADPYNFNISRYESYFSERRPFFIQGNEIFTPSGRQRNWGFYSPLELFYSRRIGRKLPDGSEVPITFGAKAFGRFGAWEYGGFVARTPQRDFTIDDTIAAEPAAVFISGRVKKQIMENSDLGILFVGKQTNNNTDGVIDIDGAFRNSNWQLAYQIARSINNSKGDFAGSAGYTNLTDKWIYMARIRYIGKDFEINQVGYVPWKGTAEFVALAGPIWFINEGPISQILIYTGPAMNYEKVDNYTDHAWVFGYNMQFRSNWGFEINTVLGKSKDSNKKYNSYSVNYSSWIYINPKWSANIWCGYQKSYNFNRDYLAFFSWYGTSISWSVTNNFSIGTSFNMWIEGNPNNKIQDVTFNSRPWISFKPFNNLNFNLYVDNLYLRSSKQLERVFIGGLFSYQFLPKSWIYLAVNELDSRNDNRKLITLDRVSVFKIKYLYYF